MAIATPRFRDPPTHREAVWKAPEFEIWKVQGDGGVKLARAPLCNGNVRCGCGPTYRCHRDTAFIAPASPSARWALHLPRLSGCLFVCSTVFLLITSDLTLISTLSMWPSNDVELIDRLLVCRMPVCALLLRYADHGRHLLTAM